MRWLWLFSVILLGSCAVEPQPIAYGTDACHFCKMTIVDNQHAAELVTVKGKAFKYDAIECMMNHLNKWKHPEVKFHLVNDYASPGELIDATQAHYIVTEAIPSPMGEFLTAFGDKEKRDQVVSETQGKAFSWETLKEEFNVTMPAK